MSRSDTRNLKDLLGVLEGAASAEKTGPDEG